MRVVFNRTREVTAQAVARAEALAETTRELVAQRAQDYAPELTGELRGSIHVDGDAVVADSPHANFVEHGTVHMAAEPFMAPAVKDGKEALDVGVRGLIV